MVTLDDFCMEAASLQPAMTDAAQVVRALGEAVIALSAQIALGPLAGSGDIVGRNADGDNQKALDVFAHGLIGKALRRVPVACVLSEESDGPEMLEPSARLAVAIDPIDGSSNIDINAGIGTIFSIRPAAGATADPFAPFADPGDRQLAAGFALYGPQTSLVLSLGTGVNIFTLDRSRGAFVLSRRNAVIPEDTAEYAINGSNYRHWEKPVRMFVDDCLAGRTGPRGIDYNTRWNASAVVEAFRVLQRGGIFLYPSDSRPGYEQGRLRLLYEAAPLAFLIEQAGGRATTGRERILDIAATAPHQRVPLIFGCAPSVKRIEGLHSLPDIDTDRTPLFAKRGLLRN